MVLPKKIDTTCFHWTIYKDGAPRPRPYTATDKRPILLAKDKRWCETFCIKSLQFCWKHKVTDSTCCTSAIYFILSTIRIDWTGLFTLKTRSGGHQYLLVYTDHFWRFAQVYGTTSKSTKLQRIPCITILCWNVEYLGKFYMTRKKNLKMACLHNYLNFVE